ncbi:MAG: histidine kinase [Ahniella sp.]|nr:histidine kinase [Ahniella sp.]
MSERHDTTLPDGLDQPLPGERIRGDKPRFYEYTRYPAFSRHWLIGRSILFLIVLGGFSMLVGVSNLMLVNDAGTAALIALLFFIGFMSFSLLGPLFATIVRYRRWPFRIERIAVVAALMLGIFASGFTDSLVSSDMKRRMEAKVQESPLVNKQQIEQAKKMHNTPASIVMRLVTGAFIYGLFGGGIALIAYWREPARVKAWRDTEALKAVREARAESEVKLSLLQSQVEPHFLFNTLAAVRVALRASPAEAEALLDALIDYLRATIPKLRAGAAQPESLLGEQLDLAGHFLRLMQLRMGQRLTVSIDCPDDLRKMPFPPLLLLSLVENAIKHGVEPKPGAVSIRVDVLAGTTDVTVRVTDDGVGLSASTLGGGVGLENVREHLRTRFGDRARLDLQSQAEGGTVASITVPRSAP